MDFQRNTQTQPVATSHATTAAPTNVGKRGNKDNGSLSRILTVVGVVVVAILLIFTAVYAFSSKDDGENKFVDSNKLQAVFLNTGQVYFGKIAKLNSSYFVVKDIYYLQTSSTGTSTTTSSANTSVSLVKLGCELHEPYDQMVINRDQVTFWENLQDNGQVAKAVATFQKANPNGQKCTDQSSASGSTGTSVQNAGTANTGSTTTTAKP